MDTQVKISIIDFLPQVIINFLIVWYLELSVTILKTTYTGLIIISDMFALPILFKTFFVPWRAEERKGFVAIALGIAIVIRIFAIVTAILTMSVVVFVGFSLLAIWILIPIIFTVLFFFGLAKFLLPI